MDKTTERDNQFEEELTLHSQKKGVLLTPLMVVIKCPGKSNLISKGAILAHG